jgi:uncharacterized surface protein with fasciclin (FAS1) repeats
VTEFRLTKEDRTMIKMLAPTAVTCVIGALALLGTAQASDHDPRGYGELKGYGQCLKTEPVEFPGTIVEAAIATPELSTLVELVVAAGLADALSQPGDFTVFAPTNDAFAAMPPDLLAAIGSNLDVLTGVLTYHVVGEHVDPRRSAIPREVTTLQGQTVFFSYGMGPQINQSHTSCEAVSTTNGTVWVIDSVLLPQYFPMP